MVAPVARDRITWELDRNEGTLIVSSTVEHLEYRLLSNSGEPLSEEWADLGSFTELEKDTTYKLQVRVAAQGDTPASDVTEITIDTHKVKTPFPLKNFLSEQFLLVVGGALLIALIIVIVGFVRTRKRANKEELGG